MTGGRTYQKKTLRNWPFLYYNGDIEGFYLNFVCLLFMYYQSSYEISPLNMKWTFHEISSLKRNLLKLETENGRF